MQSLDLEPVPQALPRRVADRIDGFRGRGGLLDPLLAWWSQQEQPVFLLTGDPGAGKSMVLAWLSGLGPRPDDPAQRAALALLTNAVKATFYCGASNGETLAASLAGHLARTVAGFGAALVETLKDKITINARVDAVEIQNSRVAAVYIERLDLSALSEEEAFRQSIVQPLKVLEARGHRSPLLILVDALDEAVRLETGSPIPDQRPQAWVAALLSRRGGLPSFVRIIASTRPDPRVLMFFRDVSPCDLARPDVGAHDDIFAYAQERLAQAAIPVHERDEFAAQLARQASGVFLYASAVLDEVLRDPATMPSLASYRLPESLASIYNDFLLRELGPNDRSWFALYEPLLGLVAVSRGKGLTTSLLAAIVGKGDVRVPLRACKQYLSGELPDGPFQIFHKSFTDFLLELNSTNADFRIDARTWHARIADHYLDADRIDAYALASLCAHLLAAGRLGEAIVRIDPAWMEVHRAQAQGSYAGFRADVELVRAAASASASASVPQLLQLRAAAYAAGERVAVLEDRELGLLVRLGRVPEAVSHARLRAGAVTRAASFAVVLRALAASGRTPQAALVDEARQVALSIDGGLERVRAIDGLVDALLLAVQADTAGPVFEALVTDIRQAIAGIEDGEQRARAERELVGVLGSLGQLDGGVRLARSIDVRPHDAFALSCIAGHLARAGRHADAFAIVAELRGKTGGESYRQRILAETLAALGEVQALAAHPDADRTFVQAETACHAVHDAFDCNDALADLSTALVAASRWEEAVRVTATITDWHHDVAAMELVEAFSGAGDLDAAQTAAGSLRESAWQERGLLRLAGGLAAAGRRDDALALVARLRKAADRASGWIEVADSLRQRGDGGVDGLIMEAVDLAVSLDDKDRKNILARATLAWLDAGETARATMAFERMQGSDRGVARDRRRHAAALRAVGAALAAAGDRRADAVFDAARDAIDRVEPMWRSLLMCELASVLAGAGCLDKAWDVLVRAGRDRREAPGWIELAAALKTAGHRDRAIQAADMAFVVAERIGNDGMRDEVLAGLVLQCRETGMLLSAEEAAGRIHETSRRSASLVVVAVGWHASRPDRAAELLATAETMARVDCWGGADEALSKVAIGCCDCDRVDEALRILPSIDDGGSRIRALCAIARRLSLAGDIRGHAMFDDALAVASRPPRHDRDALYDAMMLRRQATTLDAGDPAAAALRSQASALAGSPWADWFTWDDVASRATVLAALAVAVEPASAQSRVVDLARKAALGIGQAFDRDQGLLQLLRSLLDAGRIELARGVLDDLHGEQERHDGIEALTTAYVGAGDGEAAHRVARLETSDYHRRGLALQVAVAHARSDRMRAAVDVIEADSIDAFIESAACACANWAGAPAGAVADSISTLLEVAAWVRADWAGVLEVAGSGRAS